MFSQLSHKTIYDMISPRRGYSTRFSSFPYQLRTKSHSKHRHNSNYKKYIETKYRSGGYFNYEINKNQKGTYRSHLNSIEKKIKPLLPELDFEKNKLMMLNTQYTNIRKEKKDNYIKLRQNMLTDVDNLQIKLMSKVDKPRIDRGKIKREIAHIKNDLDNSNNLLMDIRKRINSLKSRQDGIWFFNNDGLPVLPTKID